MTVAATDFTGKMDGTNQGGPSMKRRFVLAALLAALLLLPGPARAALTLIGHYTAGDNSFDIGTFQRDADKGALLGISHKVSITFGPGQWASFVALWRKAKNTQSSSFQLIGSYKETGTDYLSLLTVAAGPGVQFSINDKGGTFTFVMAPGDFARFDADVDRVAAFLK